MSAYKEVKTKITDVSALVEALCACPNRIGRAWTAEDIEVHEEPVALYGYKGDRRAQRAHVVIRRGKVGGASNDIGFTRQEDGTFAAQISQFDHGFYGQKWQDKLGQEYGFAHTRARAEEAGYTVERVEEGEKLKARLVRFA